MKITKTQLTEMVRKIIRKSLNEAGGAPASPDRSLDEFTRQYMETALWSSTDDQDKPMDDEYNVDDFSFDAQKKMMKDCQLFQAKAGDIIDKNEGQAGHFFWLTRNGHGAGFWDGDWEETMPDGTTEGEFLTELSNKFGPQELYISDNNEIEIF